MKRTGGPLFALTLALVLLCPRPSAAANTLYGVDFNTNKLLTIDVTTGTATVVGNLSTPMSAAGLAFRGTKLYVWDNVAKKIQEIDPTTAATLNTIDIGQNFFGEGDLDFRSDGIGFLTGFGPPLYSFDITVPNSATVGNLTKTLDGLAFSPSGVLYGLSESNGGPMDDPTATLYTVNTATAALTLVGASAVAGSPGAGLAFDFSTGQLYATLSPGGGNSNLYSINPANGAATLIGPVGFGVTGIRFPLPAALPPSPGAGGSRGEGSFAGVADPPQPGTEGSFGFGFGGQLAAKSSRPALAGPFLATAGAVRTLAPSSLATCPPPGTILLVYNTAGTTTPQAGAAQASSGTAGALGWTMLAALAMAVVVGLGKSPIYRLAKR